MRKLIGVTTLLITGFSAYLYFDKQQAPELSHSQVQQQSSPLQSVSSLKNIQDTSTVKVTQNKPINNEPVNQSDFYAVNKLSDVAKSVLENAKVLPKDLNNEAYIEFDLDTLRTLESGDTFELLIPQTQESFIAEVSSTSIAANGDKSVFGSVTGADGRFHTTVLTIGKDAIYGQLTAPSGNYVFESKEQYGWIAAKRDLYRSHREEELHPTESTENEYITVKQDIFDPKTNK
ncbi:hypothetical protein ACSLBF_19725 (plasmid) [Pseudoalteromonas sp. T1lg65]|uniref:hypothetical protein n=1 Tax=Pseudoalteromonas sp. T1lg65 TaxID=2077101 RepID=UPI003F7B1D95